VEDPQPLDIVIETVGRTTYMRLSGDAVWAYSLLDPIRSLIDERRDFVIDLRGLSSMDDIGLADLLQAIRWGDDYYLDVSFIQGNHDVQQTIARYVNDASLFKWVDPE
jgi:anti-anti-sigma regulatory factor